MKRERKEEWGRDEEEEEEFDVAVRTWRRKLNALLRHCDAARVAKNTQIWNGKMDAELVDWLDAGKMEGIVEFYRHSGACRELESHDVLWEGQKRKGNGREPFDMSCEVVLNWMWLSVSMIDGISFPPLIILWNSAAGSLTLHLYSVSGMPKCSDSMSINFSSNSDTRSCGSGDGSRRIIDTALHASSDVWSLRVMRDLRG